jgi:hypothetical protein
MTKRILDFVIVGQRIDGTYSVVEHLLSATMAMAHIPLLFSFFLFVCVFWEVKQSYISNIIIKFECFF